jgi:hypothetical protein
MDTFITLLDLKPSPFVGSSYSTPQGDLAQQHIEPSDSLPVDQDRMNTYFTNYCVIL